MRHIPEEELHAYLDQALSRPQCVEIESHLAECARCRASRDEIAALRDRTTALLANLGPVIGQAPSFEVIRLRSSRAGAARRQRLSTAAWAASIAVAVVAGWEGNRWMAQTPAVVESVTTPPTQPATGPLVAQVPPPSTPVELQQPAPAPRRRHQNPAPAPAAPAAPAEPAAAEIAVEPQMQPAVTQLSPEDGHVLLGALATLPPPTHPGWRALPVGQADSSVQNRMPRVSGLPIVQVLVQEVGTDEEVTAVDQQLSTGETIRTIEGPAAKVETLIAQESAARADAGTIDDKKATLILRQGDRITAVTGPPDVLHNLLSKVMARQRR
jgi:hypothetical protein